MPETIENSELTSPPKKTIYNELEKIGQKTKQEIQTNIHLVDLYTCYSPEDIQSQPISDELRDLLLSPDTLNENLQALRAQQESSVGPIAEEASELLSEYEDYVSNLKRVRSLQKGEIRKAMQEQSGSNETDRRRAFLETIAYSGAVGEMIINRFKDQASLPPREVEAEQIKKACESRETFVNAIKNLAISEPKLLAYNLDMYQKMFATQEIQEIADTILEKDITYMLGLKSVQEILILIPEDERQEKAARLFANFGKDHLTSLTVDKFIDCSEIIGEEKSKELAVQALAGTDIRTFEVKKLIDAGLLTSEQVESAVASKTNQGGEEVLKNVKQLIDFSEHGLISEESMPLRPLIEKMIIDSLPALIDNSHEMLKLEAFLGPEKTKEIHKRLFNLDPIQYQLVYGVKDREEYIDESSLDIVCELIKNKLDLDPQHDSLLCETLMSSPNISIEDKRAWLQYYISKRSSFLYEVLSDGSPRSAEVITSTYSADEISNMLQEYLLQERDCTLIALADVINYIPENDREEVINNFIQSREDFSFVTQFSQITTDKAEDFFGPHLNKDKLETQIDLFLKTLPDKNTLYIGWLELESINDMYGIQKARQVINALLESHPEKLTGELEFISKNLTAEEYRNILLNLMNNKFAAKKLINFIDFDGRIDSNFGWPSTVDKETTRNFLINNYLEHPVAFVNRLIPGSINKFFTQEEIYSMIDQLAICHPAVLLDNIELLSQEFPKVSSEYIIQKSQNDEIRSLLAPKTSAEIIKKLTANKGPLTDDIQLKQGEDLDSRLTTIRQKLSPESVKHLADIVNISEAYELEICDMLALISNTSDNPSEAINNLQNREELELLFIQSLCKSLGIEAPATEELMQNIKGQVPLLTKVGVYSEEIQKHPNLKPVIASFVRSIITGEYQQWRFGEPTIENLTELQNSELLPGSLSLDQYNLWQQELVTSKQADRSESTASFIANCRKVIEENIQFLDIVEPSALESSSNPLEIIKSRVSSLGESIGSLNKSLQALRALEPSEINTQEINKITREVSALKAEQAKNQIRLAVMTIQNISDELSKSQQPISPEQSDLIIKESKKQIALLTRLLKDQETNGLIARLNYEIKALESSPEAGEKITIRDSSDAKTTFEIGERPVGSCQSYRTGQFRECLMSYFNQNTKIIIVENENGKPIARAVLRLLDSSDGKDDEFKPCLFLETIYSAVGLDAVSDSIIAHATAKAEQLGIPLLLSPKSQNEHGDFVSNSGSDEFQFVPSSTQLVSRNSNAPYVYSDAIGSNNSGKYKLSGLAKVEKVPG